MAHHVTFGDFMAGNFLAGDFLGGYHFRLYIVISCIIYKALDPTQFLKRILSVAKIQDVQFFILLLVKSCHRI